MKEIIIDFCEGYEAKCFDQFTPEEIELFTDLGWLMDGEITVIGHGIWKQFGFENEG